MTHRIYIVGIAIVLMIGAIVGAIYYAESPEQPVDTIPVVPHEVSTEDPIDIVLDFYTEWLQAKKSTSTDPFAMGLATQPIFGEALRTKLEAFRVAAVDGLDPVICQTNLPEQVTGRMVFELDTTAQVLVMAKDATLFEQTVVTLTRENEGWYVSDIECYPGTSLEPRTFSFEREGYLLKQVPSPFDPTYWHIVFVENGEEGHAAPLFFGNESMCTEVQGTERLCDTNQFVEATKIYVYGQMSERGIEVVRLEYME